MIENEERLGIFIRDTVAKEYAKYETRGTVIADVRRDGIEIYFNSRKPYLGQKFWSLLNEVAKKVDERLSKDGYSYYETRYAYDFLIWHYKKY